MLSFTALPHSVQQSWPIGLLFKSIPTVSKGAGGYMSPAHIIQSDSFLQLLVTDICSSKYKMAQHKHFFKKGDLGQAKLLFNLKQWDD